MVICLLLFGCAYPCPKQDVFIPVAGMPLVVRVPLGSIDAEIYYTQEELNNIDLFKKKTKKIIDFYEKELKKKLDKPGCPPGEICG